MPQMGESIVEGTIVRWLKQVGDRVDRDEPIFEITTDKVEAEIPSPAAGVLSEITAGEGQTVSVHTVVGMIRHDEEAPSAQPSRHESPEPPAPTGPVSVSSVAAPRGVPSVPVESGSRRRSSPLVRRMAREHGVNIASLEGTGIGGRVTKKDLIEYLARGGESRAQTPANVPPAPAAFEDRSSVSPPSATPSTEPLVQPLSHMRKKIAEHMVLSRNTAVHVHSVFNVDFSRIENIRRDKKGDYERAGTKLTFLAFIAKAVSDVLRHHPLLNASLEGDTVTYHSDVNLGVAVALDNGLIVPVIQRAGDKSLLELSRAIVDLAERARAKQLKPDDVRGGTFTLTNPGQFGAQFGTPIINQPQSAILGVGTIEKRTVVVGDAIAIRTMAYLTLGFDHRLIDGAVADRFMADVKGKIETFDPSEV
jgi:pyruvate dehydrogenase E2 component (dihydrolipoamide acetyltransferase)